jgi:hypothetical protein
MPHVECFPGDFNCYIHNFIELYIVPLILVIILLLVALFVLPRLGWKGVFLSILIIFFILWFYGLIPGLGALGAYF